MVLAWVTFDLTATAGTCSYPALWGRLRAFADATMQNLRRARYARTGARRTRLYPSGACSGLALSIWPQRGGAYSAWANVCGGDNPEEPDSLLLGVALREVDRLSTELAKAREAAWEDGRRVELEEAASLCAPRAHGGTAPGMFVKASRLADEIRAIGAKPRGNA